MGQAATTPSKEDFADDIWLDWEMPSEDEFRVEPRDYLEESLEFPPSLRSFSLPKRQAALAKYADSLRTETGSGVENAAIGGAATSPVCFPPTCYVFTTAELDNFLGSIESQPDPLQGLTWGQRLAYLVYKAGPRGLQKRELWYLTLAFGRSIKVTPWTYAAIFDAFTEPEFDSIRELMNCRWNDSTGAFCYLGYERASLPNPVLHDLVANRAKSHRVDVHQLLQRLEERPELLQPKLNQFQGMKYSV